MDGNRTVRNNYATWGLVTAALWGIVGMVCARTSLDVFSVGAGTAVTCLTVPGRAANQLRLEDFPKVERQVLAESVAGEKVVYRLALSHGWNLRDQGLDIKGEPLNEPDPHIPDIDNSGGYSTHPRH